eukprot:5918321-Pleurochrysis_carterae.AAC.1
MRLPLPSNHSPPAPPPRRTQKPGLHGLINQLPWTQKPVSFGLENRVPPPSAQCAFPPLPATRLRHHHLGAHNNQ